MILMLLLIMPVIALVIGLIFLIKKWPDGGIHATFSHHAASTRHASRYYALLFLITLPPIVVWFGLYPMPHLALPRLSLYVMIAAAIFQIVAACIPEKAPRITIHRSVTAISMIAILLTVVLLRQASRDFVIGSALVAMLGTVLYAVALRDRTKYQLLLQASFYALFFTAVGIAAFL